MVFSFQNGGDFNLKDKPKEGHSRGLDFDILEAAVDVNPTITVT